MGRFFPITHPPDMIQVEAGTNPTQANTHLVMGPY